MAEASIKNGLEEEKDVHPRTPSTASIRTGNPFTPIAEALQGSVQDLCARHGVEFVTLEEGTREEILRVRGMIFEHFEEIDKSHFHHLQNVDLLVAEVLQAPELRDDLEQAKRNIYAGDEQKEREIDQVLSSEFVWEMQMGMSMHDFGKLMQLVQDVIHLRGAPTNEQRAAMQRHTASEKLFEQVGITRGNFPTILLIALYHHFPEYAGADPRYEDLFHIEDKDMELLKTELCKHIPIFISIAKIIDIIEAMTSQIRTYRDPGVIRWFEDDKGSEFTRRDGQLHTSIQGELAKKCPENSDLSLTILKIVRARWDDEKKDDKVVRAGLESKLIRTEDQLIALGHIDDYKAIIERYNSSPTTARVAS